MERIVLVMDRLPVLIRVMVYLICLLIINLFMEDFLVPPFLRQILMHIRLIRLYAPDIQLERRDLGRRQYHPIQDFTLEIPTV